MPKTLALSLKINTQGAPKTLGELAQLGEAIKRSAQAADDAARANTQQAQSVGNLGGGVAELAFKFNNVVGALQSLLAAAKPAYDFLIGSNERLNAQLLASQTNLASATRIFSGGVEITDPTEKIKASQPALKAALKQIEKDTESLIGVTSQQVNELFQITLTNAAALNNQSKEFPDAIAAATSLTKGWAASLKVVGVPLDQARQEINSILKGQVDQNSILAKNLGISNEQVRKWQSQGVLVDELNKRLNTFVVGNAIAARSIDGIGSNIQDIFERIGREAGEPLLEPLIDTLDEVYQFLKQNEQAFVSFFQGFAQSGANIGGEIFDNLRPAIDALLDVLEQAGPLAETLFNLIGNGLIAITEAQGPVLEGLLQIIAKAAEGINALAELVQLNQINDAADTLEILTKTTDELSQSAINTGSSLKALNKIQQDGTKLTDEQIAQQKKLTAAAKLQVASIGDQIKALKELNPVSADNRKQRDAQVASLEQVRDALTKSSGAIRIEGKELENLGTSYEQLQKKAANAESAIARAQTSDEAGKAAKELTEAISQQAELGQITADQAAERLSKVAGNTALEVDVQQKAQETISKLRKSELDRQVKDLDAQISGVQAAADAGKLPPIAAAQEVTRLKKEQLNLQLNDLREQIAAEQAAIAAGRGSKNKLAELQTQQQKLTSDLQKEEIDGQKRVTDARITEVENAYSKEITVASLAETRKQTEIAKLQAAGTLTAKQAEAEKLKAAQTRITAEIKAEQTKLNAFNAITAASPDQAKKLEADKAASTKKLVQLEAESVKAEADLRRNAIDQIAEANQKANQKLVLAEKQRFAELSELENQGKITKEQVEQEKAKITEDRIKRELSLERDLLAKLQAQPQSEDRDKAILQSQEKIAEKRIALAESETRREEAIRKAAIERIEKAQRQALDQLDLANQERQIATQKLVNSGVLSEEQAASAKAKARKEQLRAELNLAQQQQVELEKIASSSDGKGREEAQKQALEARKKTNGLTLQLLETEKQAQDDLAKAAIAAIKDQAAARERATAIAESAFQREAQAAEVASKAIERQGNLLKAKAALQQAQDGLAQTEAGIEIDRLDRAIEIKKALDSGNVSAQERNALAQEYAALGISSESNIFALLKQRQAVEDAAAQKKRAAFVAAQEIARSELVIEQQRSALAAQRAVTEARINELKAKQASFAAQAALEEAKQLAPGRERDNAIAAAQTSISLAQQQESFAAQGTQAALTDQASQKELNTLATQTLDVQQKTALAQFNAAEAARQNAQALEYAKLQAEAIAAAAERAKAAQESLKPQAPAELPARRLGGPVAPGQPFIGGEVGPEAVRYADGSYAMLPNPGIYQVPQSGTVLTAQATANLFRQQKPTIPVGLVARGQPSSNMAPLLKEMQALRQLVADRPQRVEMPVTFNSASSGEWDDYLRLQRSIGRAGF
jgi:hypothetical protein